MFSYLKNLACSLCFGFACAQILQQDNNNVIVDVIIITPPGDKFLESLLNAIHSFPAFVEELVSVLVGERELESLADEDQDRSVCCTLTYSLIT